LQDSELILKPDGSVYHLGILPEDIGNTVITVGDPDRVKSVSKHFDSIDVQKQNREFVIHTGVYKNKRITCMSTGMGTDNIDIVLNELDALVNVDFKTRKVKKLHTALDIIRIGTSGSIHKNINVGDVLVTDISIGLEGLMNWYPRVNQSDRTKQWEDKLAEAILPVNVCVSEGNPELRSRFSRYTTGVTLTTAGFYAPQSRHIRIKPEIDLMERLASIEIDGQSITNIEMETAGIYGLAHLLGHRALSINLILANRISGEFADQPEALMEDTIKQCLDLLCN